MLARIHSFVLVSIDAIACEVEADVSQRGLGKVTNFATNYPQLAMYIRGGNFPHAFWSLVMTYKSGIVCVIFGLITCLMGCNSSSAVSKQTGKFVAFDSVESTTLRQRYTLNLFPDQTATLDYGILNGDQPLLHKRHGSASGRYASSSNGVTLTFRTFVGDGIPFMPANNVMTLVVGKSPNTLVLPFQQYTLLEFKRMQ